MKYRNRMLVAPLAAALLATTIVPANAFITPLVLADRFIKAQAKIALETPGHVEWCLQNHPGYRPQWNNYRIANGRVAYCASPYYTPPWMQWRQNLPQQ